MTIKSLSLLLALCLTACSRPASNSNAAATPSTLQLFLLAGQSNMAGRGAVEPQDRIPNPRVMMLDRALTWVPAIDPVHYDKPVAGVGPGRSFALFLTARDPNARIGLVPSAVGGSPISSWEPGALDPATGTHPYDDALARARLALRDGRFRAILWHQGESDATPALSPLYEQRLRTLIARFRADLDSPDLPFIIGELGQFGARPWTDDVRRVDSAQRTIAATVPNVAYVSSVGLLDKGDAVHFNSQAARTFGERYAAAYVALTRGLSRAAP